MNGSSDDRRQKHVSFDSSSLMRSQTLATMDEASFQRIAAAVNAQNMTSSPSKSSERLIDGRKTPDFEFYSQILPPELARQIMLERVKRNSMRTTATQTERSKNVAASPSTTTKAPAYKHHQVGLPLVHMVSEGVQTNGFNRVTHADQQTSPPNTADISRPFRPPPYQDPPPAPQSPIKKRPELKPRPSLPPNLAAAGQMPGYQLQVYHLDGEPPQGPAPQASWYGTAPRSGKHPHHHSHGHKHSHHAHHGKTTRSHSSGNVLGDHEQQQPPQPRREQHSNCHQPKSATSSSDKYLHKSLSDGKLVDDQPQKPAKAVKFLQAMPPCPGAEDDASDRDMPELAPITREECKRVLTQQASIVQDDEPDLGKTLSPLGSTSSLQELLESTSAAGSVPPTETATSNSTWIDRERQKKSVVVVEPPIKSEPIRMESIRMDSVTSTKTNETSATSEDYLTAPEAQGGQKSTTTTEEIGDDEEDDEEEVEKVEHYLESPEKEETAKETEVIQNQTVAVVAEESVEEEADIQDYAAVCEIQIKANKEQEEEVTSQMKVKSPTHSFESSSSGSYSVNNTENGKKVSPEAAAAASEVAKAPEQQPSPPTTQEEDNASGADVSKRKTELTLDLDVNAPPVMLHNLPTTATSDESSTENSMIWQRLPMGTGDVKRKRQAFEQQIKAMSMEERVQQPLLTPPEADDQQALPTTMAPNGATTATTTAICKMARKIVSEEVNLEASPGLARSPAMHQGFRQEEWIVERTPVNTPDTANDKVVVAMINLSDEETSNHVDSDVVFKSSTAATTPQDGSLRSSMQDITTSPPPKESTERLPESLGVGNQEVEVKKLSVVDPPAGFGDSPEHKRKEPRVHQAIIDQPLPQEEQLVMASEEVMDSPALQVTETFQSTTSMEDQVVNAARKESITQPQSKAMETASTCLVQSLEPKQQPLQPPSLSVESRKLSSTSSTSVSRPSTSLASKNHHSRSRSSSKERLLSTLAGSETAPRTSHEEDEVDSKLLISHTVFPNKTKIHA